MTRIQCSGCPSLEAVLLFVVIGDTEIEVGPDRIFRTTPKDLEDPIGGKSGVVNCTEHIAAREETAGRQWVIRICEINMLIAAIKFDRSVSVFGEKHNAVIIRDSSRNKSRPLAYRGARDQELLGRERRCGNRILDVSEYRINRQAHIVRADLPLEGIALAAGKWAGSKRSFRGGTERAYIHGIFERIVVDTILGIPPPPVAPWKPITEKAFELPMGS